MTVLIYRAQLALPMNGQNECKVDIIIDRYSLDDVLTRHVSVDERLLTRWTGSDGNQSDGYRTLTDWFNKQLLRVIYSQNDRESSERQIDIEYDILKEGDELEIEELTDELRANDINPRKIKQNMISWSTMRDHLQDCLSGNKAQRDSQTEWEQNSVSIAKNVTRTKVNKALRSLDSKEELPGGTDASIETQILLSCPQCLTRVPFEDALQRGFICEDHLGTATIAESYQ